MSLNRHDTTACTNNCMQVKQTRTGLQADDTASRPAGLQSLHREGLQQQCDGDARNADEFAAIQEWMDSIPEEQQQQQPVVIE
jgi:hypothetical protein